MTQGQPPLVFEVSTGNRPFTANQVMTANHFKRAGMVREWKEATAMSLALNKIRARFDRAWFEFAPVYPKYPITDTSNVHPSTKAIVDALVDAGMIPDDNPYHNAYEGFDAPVVDRAATTPYIMVTVRSLPALEGHRAGECKCAASHQARQLAG